MEPRLLILAAKFCTLAALVAGAAMVALLLPLQAPAPAENGRIVFERGGTEMHTMLPDGSEPASLATGTEPSWSPNGLRIAYSSPGLGADVFIVNADGSRPHNLDFSPGDDESPDWCTQSSIVFRSDRVRGGDVYIMNADGTERTRLTTDSAEDDQPTCSPDGTDVAFVRSPSERDCDIWIMGVDGSGQADASNNSNCDDSPDWSPDGTQIVFASDRDGDYEICIMDVAAGNQDCTLTANSAFDGMPAWSPDGTQIVFASDRGGTSDIYVMNIDGKSQTNLTNDPADDAHPDWQPVLTVDAAFALPGIAEARARAGRSLAPSTGVMGSIAVAAGIAALILWGAARRAEPDAEPDARS